MVLKELKVSEEERKMYNKDKEKTFQSGRRMPRLIEYILDTRKKAEKAERKGSRENTKKSLGMHYMASRNPKKSFSENKSNVSSPPTENHSQNRLFFRLQTNLL
jgi:hypothetical protein